MLESEDLKVYLEECSLLKKILKKGVEWEQDANSLLQNAEHLWNIDIIGEGTTSCLILRLERQVLSIETAMKAGVSLGLEFSMIPKLQDACSTLKWCIKAISFSSIVPTRKVILLSFTSSQDSEQHMVTDCLVLFSFLAVFLY